ncbi:hypothetical protein OH460_07890 [Vibrio sp. Makdt]|uniref:hypothetical protein n=1 Tax=Vibrio sp. Makdt TaxID=2998828 RepID=UPI0022CD7AB3|nr:hypothetical protein [Vibrio sp. Makdt]MDA0152218.1 hypothetical protein [Vibrio sp. Makdt]
MNKFKVQLVDETTFKPNDYSQTFEVILPIGYTLELTEIEYDDYFADRRDTNELKLIQQLSLKPSSIEGQQDR